MLNRVVDGYGRCWRDVALPGGATRRVRDIQDHEDVALEMREIQAERKATKQLFWPLVVLTFLMNLVVLSLLLATAAWLLPELSLSVVAVVICVAYSSAVLLVTVHAMGARLGRMEYHALTVQNAVLTSHRRERDST